mmetsp:Transcript_4744/g.13670  ORF Transcript_4744/g.13670 Transcript_4744/m.13670 type:complete len:251 (+) Transcript_4744:90-842(+)
MTMTMTTTDAWVHRDHRRCSCLMTVRLPRCSSIRNLASVLARTRLRLHNQHHSWRCRNQVRRDHACRDDHHRVGWCGDDHRSRARGSHDRTRQCTDARWLSHRDHHRPSPTNQSTRRMTVTPSSSSSSCVPSWSCSFGGDERGGDSRDRDHDRDSPGCDDPSCCRCLEIARDGDGSAPIVSRLLTAWWDMAWAEQSLPWICLHRAHRQEVLPHHGGTCGDAAAVDGDDVGRGASMILSTCPLATSRHRSS